ncbi:MAG: hypothetical protein HFE86_01040 [Clostridiales bacterium]|nr:hypothetical protein [Clostridiales bacterium]
MANGALNGDILVNNPEMKQYFETLPPYVQETLRQSSGGQITSLAELQSAAEKLLQK